MDLMDTTTPYEKRNNADNDLPGYKISVKLMDQAAMEEGDGKV
jgi:hypothetical protein